MNIKRFGVVIEGGEPGSGYSAYVPDLPGCIRAGETLDAVKRDIRSAIDAHIQWMVRDGEPVPEPRDIVPVEIPNASVTFVDVDIPHAPKSMEA